MLVGSKFKWQGVVFLVLSAVWLVSSSWAVGVRVICQNDPNYDPPSGLVCQDTAFATPLPVNRVVQFIKVKSGTLSAPSPSNGPNHLGTPANEEIVAAWTVGHSFLDDQNPTSLGAGKFIWEKGDFSGRLYVRVWSTTSLPAGDFQPADAFSYADVGPKDVSAAGDVSVAFWGLSNFWLNKMASAPPKVTITNTQADPNSDKIIDPDVGFDVAIIKWSLDPSYDYTKVELAYSTENTAGGDNPPFLPLGKSAVSYTFGKYVGGAELQPNTTYYVKVRGVNNFGNGPWSDIKNLKTKAGGTATFQYDLPAGIVQFMIPFNTAGDDFKINGKAFKGKYINDLIKEVALNKASTFGWWDGSKPVGYTIGWSNDLPQYTKINDSNLPGDGAVALQKNTAYQIHLTQPISFTVTGKIE